MKQLIINGLVNKYNKTANVVGGESSVYSEPFSLCDEEACNQCPVSKKTNCEKQEIALVNNGGVPVEVIKIEEIIKSFSNNASSCDFLMIEENSLVRNQIVLCELTCSQEAYVNPFKNTKGLQLGKRAKAEKQLHDSMEFLLGLSKDCQDYIVHLQKRVCLFAWKDPSNNSKKNNSMKDFLRTPSSMARTLLKQQSKSNCDYTFMEVKYPEVFNW